MEIDCGVCLLRPWRVGDEPSLTRHANDREIWLDLRDRFPHPYTRADAEAWVQFASSLDPQTNFAIDIAGQAVGGIGLHVREDVERVSAEIGYWLGRDYWGRGVMSAAVPVVTGYAFATLDLTRVYALPYERNRASIRVLEKAGYTREGWLRRSAIKDGVVLDQVLFAITDFDIGRARTSL